MSPQLAHLHTAAKQIADLISAQAPDTVPSAAVKQHAVPSAAVKQHAVPITGTKQHAVPNAGIKQHAVPSVTVKQHPVPNAAVKQHAVLKFNHECHTVNGATLGADAVHQPGQPPQTTDAHLDSCCQHYEGVTQTSSASFDTTLAGQLSATAHDSAAVALEQAEETEVRPDRATRHACERAVAGRFQLVTHCWRLQTKRHVWQGI